MKILWWNLTQFLLMILLLTLSTILLQMPTIPRLVLGVLFGVLFQKFVGQLWEKKSE